MVSLRLGRWQFAVLWSLVNGGGRIGLGALKSAWGGAPQLDKRLMSVERYRDAMKVGKSLTDAIAKCERRGFVVVTHTARSVHGPRTHRRIENLYLTESGWDEACNWGYPRERGEPLLAVTRHSPESVLIYEEMDGDRGYGIYHVGSFERGKENV